MRAALLLFATTAYADPELHAHVEDPPPLTLAPGLRWNRDLASRAETLDDHRELFHLGPRAILSTEVRTFAEGMHLDGNHDGLAGSWANAHYDVALDWGIHLEVDAEIVRLAPELNGMFDRGFTTKVSIALTRYLRWGLNNLAWISFGVETEQYVGRDRVEGIPQRGTTVGLRLGTTF